MAAYAGMKWRPPVKWRPPSWTIPRLGRGNVWRSAAAAAGGGAIALMAWSVRATPAAALLFLASALTLVAFVADFRGFRRRFPGVGGDSPRTESLAVLWGTVILLAGLFAWAAAVPLPGSQRTVARAGGISQGAARVQDALAAPCRTGQVKASRDSGIYYALGHQDYVRTTVNVTCYDTPADAEAAGFRRAIR